VKKSPIAAGIVIGALGALLTGCANGTLPAPGGPNVAAMQMRSLHVSPDKASKSTTYQWVTNGNDALQYDYPKSTNSIGSISGLDEPGGECTTGKHAFWIVRR
jgi:hypothetical protein